MEPEEGALFLLHWATILDPNAPLDAASQSDREAARQISIAMDGLPLALDQAGAFIEETQSSLSDYLQLYHTRQADLLQRRGKLVTDHPDPVATTWSLSFEKVQQANPAAADLLRLCAFLDPNVIQEEILTKGATELGPVLKPVATDPIKLNEAMGALLAYSLVRRYPDHTFTVHRLVHAVVKYGINKSTQRRWAERAVRAVNLAFPKVEYENWLAYERYIPHVLACAALIEEWEMSFPEARQLSYETGRYLFTRAQYGRAEELYRQALNLSLNISKQVPGTGYLETAKTLHALGWLYRVLNWYDKAESLVKEALEIREKVLGSEHEKTADSLHALAWLYQDQGRYEEAESLYQQALTIREKVLGPEDRLTAETLHDMGELYQIQGKYEQAEPLYQRALAIRERVLGSEHPDTAQSLNNLAELYRKQGKYEQAQPLYLRAISIDEKVYGPDHPEVATDLNNLATLYQDQGRYEQAEPLFQRARAIRESGQKA